ncbi:MAG: hypothetical protein A3G33_06205 [Omnitrophica bacterium RIFCSPLOWO2_12_FULL_44_17]|uniref:ATP-dependent protease n=1 Tax=Candidatus Danuiimicrobium aquiferis TaxID=1801832 RepID=A0A1G1KR20_9BACT|nr:MAG: hypothetical protein A3B72_02690 [Omnitrophica bacterium RIFCSPHIGHO2_02_FULL_45_28]OGW88072.1 MAG: hypothetical protein A3E74_00590 [Omnitrophica bacterium RIFCSPHIGHO2_12_FULL_44_12]OGW95376.1 MAG: hypothetical protein A3G33_06205 [Omnitrophica bacterium RIFCSPLOWO2_12_FULL_44_17]OGX04078.1 MAG: hypothetical protein A3J12_08770 [Omnitrophica bacterium RIFCSPLOWO2_02_FULL_44_11]
MADEHKDNKDFEKTQKDLAEMVQKLMQEVTPRINPAAEPKQPETDEEQKKKRDKILEFNLKPKDVKKYLDRFVIKQEDAKRVLSTAICDHYNHIRLSKNGKGLKNYMKQNILILGPTGVGKTYLIRHLADLIGVPFVKADATKFSETGYVGGDVDDLIRDLVHKANGDIELAQYGIIYMDEIDKITSAPNAQGRDVSGAGVQRNLLKIMEETEIPLRNPQDIQSQLQGMLDFQRSGKIQKPMVNTKHILFIGSGACDGLRPIIEKRLKESHIGFGSQPKKTDSASASNILKEAKTQDFTEFGFESEFIGRLPIRVVCDPLNEEDLYQILTACEESILAQYLSSFSAYDISIHPQEKALWEISKFAAREKTGARGLFTICERVFRDLKYELPSSNIREFTLNPEMVLNPKSTVQELLKEERKIRTDQILRSIDRFEEIFAQRTNVLIGFDLSARETIEEKVLSEEHDAEKWLANLLSNYEYGLKLIQNRKPREKFILTKDVIQNPNGTLDEWIKEAYDK